VDSVRRTLSDGQIEHAVQPRLMAVLMSLAKAYPAYVDRTRLVSEVWKVEHLSDQAVNNAIAKLRNLLGDNSTMPKFILTERLGGYRLLVEPIWVTEIELARRSRDRRISRSWWILPLAGLIFAAALWGALRPSGYDGLMQFLEDNPGRWEVEVADPDES